MAIRQLGQVPTTKKFEPNIKSEHYFVAHNTTECWRCTKPTKVWGFFLPEGHHVYDPDEDENPSNPQNWYQSGSVASLPFVVSLCDNALRRIGRLAPQYKLAYSKMADTRYYMNHCEHCGVKQGDFKMYQEPHGAFFPMDEAEAARITVYRVNEPFEADASSVEGFHLLDAMNHQPQP